MYEIITETKKDKFKLMHVYIPILQQNSKEKLSYTDLRYKLKHEFGLSVTIGDLDIYFEPTLGEELLDNNLIANNLMIGYD